MDIYLFLLIVHLVGTILGVGGATMIEVQLNKALKNNDVSLDERALLGTDYKMVRVGLVLAIFSGFGFLLIYKFTGHTERLYDPMMWAKFTMIIVIAVNAVLLQARKISLYWGAALSFTSWWTVAIVSVLKSNGVHIDFFELSSFLSIYTSTVGFYLILIVMSAFALDIIRKHLNT